VATGVRGTGAWKECKALIDEMLLSATALAAQASSGEPPAPVQCHHKRCAAGVRSAPHFVGHLIATENFARSVLELGLPEDSSLREISRVGADYCATPWNVSVKVGYTVVTLESMVNSAASLYFSPCVIANCCDIFKLDQDGSESMNEAPFATSHHHTNAAVDGKCQSTHSLRCSGSQRLNLCFSPRRSARAGCSVPF
jgi:hypothetical protein